MRTTIDNHVDIWTKLSISSLLNYLGHSPEKSDKGHEIYSRILPDSSAEHPTFVLNTKLDVWFDRSLSAGGTLKDFAARYWPGVPEGTIIEKLESVYRHAAPQRRQRPSGRVKRARRVTWMPHYEFSHCQALGTTPYITHFLKGKGLWEKADSNLMEVCYFSSDQKGARREYTAVGWPNEKGGWEILSPHLRGRIGPRGMTFIERSRRALAIFLDFGDYLENRAPLYRDYASVLIVNSAALIPSALQRAASFNSIRLFLRPCHECSRQLREGMNIMYPQSMTIEIQ